MEISFKQFELQSDSDDLANLIASQTWPFHVHSNVSKEQILESIQEGNYTGASNQTFWIISNKSERIGIIKLFEMEDLEDGTPLFDLRILNQFQGKEIGKSAVKWLTKYLFEGWSSLNRIEGTTRIDNIAMRKIFQSCGYLKEGHYRNSWPAENGIFKDTVRYAILRNDWQSGNSTPVNWAE